MNQTTWIVLAAIGFALATVGGFGNHVLSSFRGRTLEAYCRLRGKRERFGHILDHHVDAQNAAFYLFVLGASIALVALGVGVADLIRAFSTEPQVRSGYELVSRMLSVSIVSAALLACLFSWLPKIIVRNGASVILYHSWKFWFVLLIASRPLSALESMFIAIGRRLSDHGSDSTFEEESLEDEIRTMVMAGERDGLVTKSMREMISGVMNLDEGQVSQIMTPRSKIDAINIDSTWPEILETVCRSGRTRLPVYRESVDHVVGVLFVKDIMPMLEAQEKSHVDKNNMVLAINTIMREPWIIPGTRQIDELLKDFLVRRNHMAIVVDEFQQTIGVVTIEDALEEIVGEIADELDTDEPEQLFREDADGGYTIAGTLEIANANRLMSLELPESDDYETVAGLIISNLGIIPKIGTKTQVGRYKFTVTQSSARQVQRVHLTFHQ